MFDTILNIILFSVRISTFILTLILTLNLWGDWRAKAQQESDGLEETRISMLIMMAALLLENLVYFLGYVHGSFTTSGLNRWLTQAKPLVIVARIGVLYAVIRLFILFYKRKG